MKRQKKRLILQQIDLRLSPLRILSNHQLPAEGWIYTLRTALNISLRQLAERMGITAQSVKALERNEKTGAITFKSIQEVAEALDMKFVYALLPKESSLEEIIEKRAKVIATEIIKRTSQSMKLENQENSEKMIQEAIKEKTQELKDEMPKFLWNQI